MTDAKLTRYCLASVDGIQKSIVHLSGTVTAEKARSKFRTILPHLQHIIQILRRKDDVDEVDSSKSSKASGGGKTQLSLSLNSNFEVS